jgi:nitroreductase
MIKTTREGTDSLFDAIYTQRAIRRWRPDPVPAELLRKVLEAATKAPSGSNKQPWRWIVVRDQAKRQAISTALSDYLAGDAAMREYFERGSNSSDQSTRLMLTGALGLAENMAQAPVFIFPCLYGGNTADRLSTGSSIYPAVQNLLLAARGLGLGTVLTTFQARIEDVVRKQLGLPEDAIPVALIPLGYPDANFGPTRRKPISEVVYWDAWGQSPSEASK